MLDQAGKSGKGWRSRDQDPWLRGQAALTEGRGRPAGKLTLLLR